VTVGSRCLQLRNVLARVTRATEALQDGEWGLAEQLLEDLANDLWIAVEGEERSRQ
jgi:hypothetical protein